MSIGIIFPEKTGLSSTYFGVISSIEKLKQQHNCDNFYIDMSESGWNDTNYDKDSFRENVENNNWNNWFVQQLSHKDNFIIGEYLPIDCLTHSSIIINNQNQYRIVKQTQKTALQLHQNIIQYENDFFLNNIANKFIGVVARGLDHLIWHPQYGNQNKDTYKDGLLKLCEKTGLNNVFIISEDPTVITYLETINDINLVYYKNIFRYTDENYEKDHHWFMNNPRPQHKKRNGIETFAQILTMSKCAHLIGRFCGMLNASIAFSESNIESITLL